MDKIGLAGLKILLLVGAIAVISGGMLYRFDPQFSPPAFAICTDSDGGLNLFVKGETCSGNSRCETDFCDGTRLTEYYCNTGKIRSIKQDCEIGCDEGKCLPLKASIINPMDNETINTNFTILEAETNGNAVCEFSLGFAGRNGGGGSRPREMENTGGVFHSQLVGGLRETNESESYSLNINCKNSISNAKDSVRFFVDL